MHPLAKLSHVIHIPIPLSEKNPTKIKLTTLEPDLVTLGCSFTHVFPVLNTQPYRG